MQIHGSARVHGAQPVGSPHAPRLSKPQAPYQPGTIQDELQISDGGQLVDQIRHLPEMRQGRVDAIRSQIAEGSYETDEKISVALDRLLEEIG